MNNELIKFVSVSFSPPNKNNIFTRTFMSSSVMQNKCLQNPCQNGGTCTESSAGGGFECRCSIGYKGMNCEGETNICSK